MFQKEASLKKDIDHWLWAPDPSNTHNRLQGEHHEGTGDWFFEIEKFKTWRDMPASMLWINGIRKSQLYVPGLLLVLSTQW
jgi:hypothetical protein